MQSVTTKVGLAILVLVFFCSFAPASPTFAEREDDTFEEFEEAFKGAITSVKGLQKPAAIIRESNGIPHLLAKTDHDLYFLQGWVHAQDRFFQMDVTRREASGTLAELLGPAELESDVSLRPLRLRRAAELSMRLLSPSVQEAFEAYSAGVNAFMASHPLPPEYRELELTKVDPWTPLDSFVIAKAIAVARGLSLDDIDRTITLLTYQEAGGILGFDGTLLFFEDLFRSAPFDQASTVPDASQPPPRAPRYADMVEDARRAGRQMRPELIALCRQYLDRIRQVRFFRRLAHLREGRGGSNAWAVSGEHTRSGVPLLANDPHLALDMPATFYQVHQRIPRLNVSGVTFAGAPFVIQGQNRVMAWGSTTNFIDVADIFQEVVVPDSASPSGLSTVHRGLLEPIAAVPQVFRYNTLDDGTLNNLVVAPPGGTVDGIFIPPAVLFLPQRNERPIIALDLAAGTALSLQLPGFGGTREQETFFLWNRARNLDDFTQGLQFFDDGSQNWAYADTRGNIAYFSAGKVPIREDLQAGFVNGLPPFFIRNGTGGNEWLPELDPDPGHPFSFQVLPFEEMPQIVNPRAGFFVNANNEPAGMTLDNDPLNQRRPGGGIFYLSPGYDLGARAGRITQMIKERLTGKKGKVSLTDMKTMQADTVMLDAQVFTPFIVQAFERARLPGTHPALVALAADRRVAEAVDRLQAWDFSSPTGIPKGFDASDEDGQRFPPSEEEIASSVAATIYSVWRGQIIRNTVDAVLDPVGLPRPDSRGTMIALRHLLDNFDQNQGFGASGLNFFNVPGVPNPNTRRDILLLKSVADALDLLAGEPFATAFNFSPDQDDYRWGRLHRVVFEHPLDGLFDVPPAGGAFPPPFGDPNLPGIPTDGGFEVVDASTHSARADSSNEFMFERGPNRRFVGELRPGRVRAKSSLPGGVSGVLGSPFYVNLLGPWLTNDPFRVLVFLPRILGSASSVEAFVPGKPNQH